VYGDVDWTCEHGNEFSSSIKDEELLAQLNDYYTVKKESDP